MKKEKQGQIPKKNYVYLMLLALVTCLILGYFVKWYRMREQEQVTRVVQISSATEIKAEEIDNYLLENPDVIVYISDSSNDSRIAFENVFENYLHNKELLNKMVYIDTSILTEKDRLKVQDLWFNGKEIIEPNFLVIESGKKVGQLYSTSTEIKLNDVHQFLTRYEVVE